MSKWVIEYIQPSQQRFNFSCWLRFNTSSVEKYGMLLSMLEVPRDRHVMTKRVQWSEIWFPWKQDSLGNLAYHNAVFPMRTGKVLSHRLRTLFAVIFGHYVKQMWIFHALCFLYLCNNYNEIDHQYVLLENRGISLVKKYANHRFWGKQRTWWTLCHNDMLCN